MNRNSRTWQWDDIRFFLAIAREGSFSGAARALDVGHVTVARRVALLEKRLAVKLVARTPDGLALTPSGQALLRKSAAMEDAALELERTAAGRDSLTEGTVRLTATEALAHLIVAPAIASLRERYPGLQLDVITGVRSLDIARREADLGIRFARPSNGSLVCRKLGEVGFSLYATRGYLARHGIPARGEGLGGHDLIMFTGAPAATSPFFLGESLDGARIAVRCDNPLIQFEAAAKGAGIAELACFLGDASAALTRVWQSEMVRRPVWLIVHQDLSRSARVRAVSGAIIEEFQRQSRALRGARSRQT